MSSQTMASDPATSLDPSAQSQPRGARWFASWKLWLVLLIVAVGLIAAAVTFPVYRRMQAFDCLDAQGIDYELTDDNAWLTEFFGKWARGFRRVRSISHVALQHELVAAHISVLNETRIFDGYSIVPISRFSVESLTSLNQLESITVWSNSADELMYEWFSRSPHLREVTLLDSSISHRTLKELSQISTLHEVDLLGARLTDADFRELDAPPWLSNLSMSECEIGAKGGQWFASMPALKSLALHESTLDGACLEHIGRMRQLRSLLFNNCTGITDADVRHLGNLRSLRILQLHGCTGLTDACVAYLEGLPNLEFLSLPPEAISHTSIESLRTIPRLREVYFDRTLLADEELKNILNNEW